MYICLASVLLGSDTVPQAARVCKLQLNNGEKYGGTAHSAMLRLAQTTAVVVVSATHTQTHIIWATALWRRRPQRSGTHIIWFKCRRAVRRA